MKVFYYTETLYLCMCTTGIAVFAYNRPNHLKRVLSGLQENDVKHLYIFADGAKNEQDKKQVSDVRNIIERIEWCQTMVTVHDRNLGLADSLTSGIKRVFEDHERIIVLEDDCVPSSNFVSFMNTSLERYADNERVMNVNGYSPPVEIPDEYPYDIYFTYRSSSWGWGTWKSAWNRFDREPFTLSELINNKKQIKETCQKAGRDLFPMMKNQLRDRIDSWAVWWSYAIAASDGVCVNPVNSKIQNIGHDGTGTHTAKSSRFDVQIDNTPIQEYDFPESVRVNSKVNKRYNRFISGGYMGILGSILNYIKFCMLDRLTIRYN